MSEFAKTKFVVLFAFAFLGIYFLFIKSYIGLFVLLLLIIFRIIYHRKQEKLYETIFNRTFKEFIDKYGTGADVIKANSLYYDNSFIPLYTRIRGNEKLILCLYANSIVIKLYDRCLDLSDLSDIIFNKDKFGYFFIAKFCEKEIKITFPKASEEQIVRIENIIKNY